MVDMVKLIFLRHYEADLELAPSWGPFMNAGAFWRRITECRVRNTFDIHSCQITA